jgi:MFS superfamily sulfate permease-like transporter
LGFLAALLAGTATHDSDRELLGQDIGNAGGLWTAALTL